MSRPKRRAVLARKASYACQNIKDLQKDLKKWAIRIYLASILVGFPITSALYFILHLDLVAIPLYILFSVGPIVFHVIISYTKQKLDNERKLIQKGAALSIDGSWTQRKNSDFCIVDLIDCKSHKIVDYEIVIKDSPRHPSSYKGSSKGMETEGARKIFARWKNNKNVKYIIHDLDSSVSKALRESGWKVTELYDVNHVVKSWNLLLGRLSKREKLYIEEIEHSLTSHLTTMIYSTLSIKKKLFLWRNAKNHFCGNHKYCLNRQHKGTIWSFRKNKNALKVLDKLIKKGEKYITKCIPKIGNTQCNESFHNTKCVFAPKRSTFPVSIECRFALAVLKFNEYNDYEDILKNELGIKINQDCKRELEEMYNARQNKNAKRRTEEYRKIVREYRKKRNIQIEKMMMIQKIIIQVDLIK